MPAAPDSSLVDDTVATVRPLRRDAPAISPRLTGAQVARLFEEERVAPAFAVVVERRPIGLIDRLGFVSRFATLYGRELYGHRPISQMMDPEPLVVESDLPVEEASRRVFTAKPKALQTGFIMTEGAAYVGIVTGVDLLRALAGSLATTNEHLRRAQAELVQSEKMAALGGLVAGIAHEINTPIGSALTAATAFGERAKSFGELVASGTIRRSDIDRFIAGAMQASEYMEVNIRRASELISSFKQVAVDQTSDERRRFRLRQCLEDVLLSLHPRLRKERIAVTLDCPEDTELDSYPGALAQIVTNLVLNTIVHAFAEREDRAVNLSAATTGAGRVRLAVADNGHGIPPEHLPQIFDPFFTTRRGAGGTGLGLHIVFNLVTQRLDGTITAANGSDDGAVFTLDLPLTAP